MRGFVKRFDVERGIGIITVSATGEKLPVILSDILSRCSLAENDHVSFGVRESQGHRFAANVSSGEAAPPGKNLSLRPSGFVFAAVIIVSGACIRRSLHLVIASSSAYSMDKDYLSFRGGEHVSILRWPSLCHPVTIPASGI